MRYFLLLLLSVSVHVHAQTSLGSSEFSLRNVDNRMISFDSYPQARGYIIVFTCNHCPFAKLYTERLNALNTRYEKLGVPLLAINAMDTLLYEDEGFDRMQEKAAREKFTFPYLQDKLQLAGKFFQAKHTPQVFVVWNEQGKRVIKYTGAIDDNGDHPELATSFIAPVIDDLLNNRPVRTNATESFGCKIYYRK